MTDCLSASRQRGVSLIEVLVAVLIFSVGMIGLAGLLVLATRANHGGYVRTQVTYLAHNMANRMSANPIGVWNGNYNADYPASSATVVSCASGCTPAVLAQHDSGLWSRQLKTFLPDPKATISCSTNGLSYNPIANKQVDKRPPFGGTCEMTITWADRGNGAQANRETTPQTFAWEFQP